MKSHLKSFLLQRRPSLFFKMYGSILSWRFSSRSRLNSASTDVVLSALTFEVPSASKALRHLWIRLSRILNSLATAQQKNLFVDLFDCFKLKFPTKYSTILHSSFSCHGYHDIWWPCVYETWGTSIPWEAIQADRILLQPFIQRSHKRVVVSMLVKNESFSFLHSFCWWSSFARSSIVLIMFAINNFGNSKRKPVAKLSKTIITIAAGSL